MKVRPEDSLKIENIVASAKVTDYLDLPMLASKIDGAEYNKKRFPGVVALRDAEGRAGVGFLRRPAQVSTGATRGGLPVARRTTRASPPHPGPLLLSGGEGETCAAAA